MAHVSGDTQPCTGVHALHVDAPLASAQRYVPDAHCEHCELLAVVQLSALTHCATGVHDVQTVEGPVLSTNLPDTHDAQFEFDADVQVS